MRSRSALASIAIHLAAVVLMAFVGSYTRVTQIVAPHIRVMPLTAPRLNGPIGGGGAHDPLPPSKGAPPPVTVHKVFIPPAIRIATEMPKLPVEIAMAEAPKMDVSLANFGDPFGKIGPPSAGPGGPYGYGNHGCCGIGDQDGPGVHGNGQPIPYRTVHHYSAPPQLIYKVEPEYSEEARKSRFEGTVVLAIEVDANGHTSHIRVVRPLGLGLDQKAIEAVMVWRFRPAVENGKPAAAPATVEVNFRLL